jgi:MoaA/NifB/PqqE/SkfB family radical SAM enzyme
VLSSESNLSNKIKGFMNIVVPIAIPPSSTWQLHDAVWRDGELVSDIANSQYLIASPALPVREGHSYCFSFTIHHGASLVVGFQDAATQEWLYFTTVSGPERHELKFDSPMMGKATEVVFVLAKNAYECRLSDIALHEAAPNTPEAYWTARVGGHWSADRRYLQSNKPNRAVFANSPVYALEAGKFHVFELNTDVTGGDEEDCGFFLQLRTDRYDGPIRAERIVSGKGICRTAISLSPQELTKVVLVIGADRHGSRLLSPRVELRSYDFPETAGEVSGDVAAEDTELPHWRPWQRRIHRRCKRSRLFNSFVSAVEMRLGREELLSLPQYVALCPTGQCNALCPFCSVTINRTGIIKRQLPLPKIQQFLAPMTRTIHMYGLEGNGEPTLHGDFQPLLLSLLRDKAKVYLITNGSRLTPQLSSILLDQGMDSINFSLNAASATAHRAVMKLKNHAEVLNNIRMLVRGRGEGCGNGKSPVISVSFVVTQQNIDEIEDFLRLAENDLQVDRILIRPLSELGNDIGTVEDLRGLEPYASSVRDMLEAVEEYMADTPRRSNIYITPDNFRAVRPDPADVIVKPAGYEGRLLAPRRRHWQNADAGLYFSWGGSGVKIRGESSGGFAMASGRIPVEPNRELTFKARGWSSGVPVTISVMREDGSVVQSAQLPPGDEGSFGDIEFICNPGESDGLFLAVSATQGDLTAQIDFLRLHTPGQGPQRVVRLPHRGRWEVDDPQAEISWCASQMLLQRRGAAGPYIIKSYAAPCREQQSVVLPVEIIVTEGALGIGILDESSAGYLRTYRFDSGFHRTQLEFESGSNRSFRIVIYAAAEPTLAATIDWLDGIEAAPAWLQSEFDREYRRLEPRTAPADASARSKVTSLVVKADSEPVPTSVIPVEPTDSKLDILAAIAASSQRAQRKTWWQRKLKSAKWVFEDPDRIRHFVYSKMVHHRAAAWQSVRNTIGAARASAIAQSWQRFAYGKPTIYCQKPWTDIANFSVDGRMDVCCIATGASQERFALGNMFEHDFQTIWNGSVMREFRRTVNGSAPLPPCQRCPMAHAYQGPFFHPDYTLEWLRNVVIGRHLLGRLRGFPGAGILQYVLFYPLQFALFLPCYISFNFLFFRGFKR